MRIIPQHVSGHVRDTCMKILGNNTCNFYMLVTGRRCFRINNVSFRPQWYGARRVSVGWGIWGERAWGFGVEGGNSLQV